jgi:superfamily I DNA/RNA helicase
MGANPYRHSDSQSPDVQVFLGPPGTGKTTRLMRVLEEELAKGTQPERIGFHSFTVAAVTEAKDRACRKFGLDPSRFEDGFRTIHSQAFRLMGGGSVLNAKDMALFCERWGYGLSEQKGDQGGDDPNEPPRNTDDDDLRAAFDWCRVRRVSLEEGPRTFEGNVDLLQLQTFVERYVGFKREMGRIDFTDMLEICLSRGLARRRDVLIIDEAQDLSPLQIALVKVWMAKADRVYIAGDDDQAIYGFGGAEPDWLIALTREHRTEILGQSWRVPQAAHAVAQAIIARNQNRVAKAYAPREEKGAVSELSRHEAIASIVPGEPTFVLARNIRTLMGVSGDLFRERVPYRCERKGICPLRREALVKAVNAAVAFWKRSSVTWGEFSAVLSMVPAALLGPRGTLADAKRHAKQHPDAPMDWLLPNLRRAMEELGGPVGVLMGEAEQETRDYLRDLLGDGDRLPEPHVTVTTIHASKGREADHVILFQDFSANEAGSMERDPEPETRVAYVAVTRTKNRLTFVRREGRFGFPYPVWAGE